MSPDFEEAKELEELMIPEYKIENLSGRRQSYWYGFNKGIKEAIKMRDKLTQQDK